MADKTDLPRVLADLVRAAFDYNTTDSQHYAERVAEELDLIEFEDDGDGGDQGRPFLPPAETVAGVLREALGIPAPVTYDPTDEFSVMDAGYRTVRTVADRYGKLTEVGRVGDEVIVIPPPGIGALFYDPARFVVLREALDRAAMPGQAAPALAPPSPGDPAASAYLARRATCRRCGEPGLVPSPAILGLWLSDRQGVGRGLCPDGEMHQAENITEGES